LSSFSHNITITYVLFSAYMAFNPNFALEIHKLAPMLYKSLMQNLGLTEQKCSLIFKNSTLTDTLFFFVLSPASYCQDLEQS